jgi:hypothetical protein
MALLSSWSLLEARVLSELYFTDGASYTWIPFQYVYHEKCERGAIKVKSSEMKTSIVLTGSTTGM